MALIITDPIKSINISPVKYSISLLAFHSTSLIEIIDSAAENAEDDQAVRVRSQILLYTRRTRRTIKLYECAVRSYCTHGERGGRSSCTSAQSDRTVHTENAEDDQAVRVRNQIVLYTRRMRRTIRLYVCAVRSYCTHGECGARSGCTCAQSDLTVHTENVGTIKLYVCAVRSYCTHGDRGGRSSCTCAQSDLTVHTENADDDQAVRVRSQILLYTRRMWGTIRLYVCTVRSYCTYGECGARSGYTCAQSDLTVHTENVGHDQAVRVRK